MKSGEVLDRFGRLRYGRTRFFTLNATSPWRLHFAQNAGLILTSIFLLPLSTFILFSSYVFTFLFGPDLRHRRKFNQSARGFQQRTILVTGVGMTKGLALARLFYEAGHNVIGADFEPYGVHVCGRYSRSLKKFYRLPKPNAYDGAAYYINALLQVIKSEKVDIWVSCSGVASALEDGQAKEIIEKRSSCRAVQFDVEYTGKLHEKDTFIQETERCGLPTPETHNVTSRGAVHKVLQSPRKDSSKRKSYIMKSVGMDDSVRGNMTLLPRRSVSDTYNHVAQIPISDEKPWVLQQYVRGKEYLSHALIINSEVKMFVACPSAELLMHYEALPSESGLAQAMLEFTRKFVARSGKVLNGHLSFDFMVEEHATDSGAQLAILPIECNPRAHTAVALFRGQAVQMARAYTDILRSNDQVVNGNSTSDDDDESPSAHSDVSIVKADDFVLPHYWFGHDLVMLVLLPFLHVLLLRQSLLKLMRGCAQFLAYVLFWKDGTYEVWDPLPAWALYHVYWPGHFLACILQKRKWSRINVGTTKMFTC
ncbi:MAG: hypothetical protein Q9183_002320 [Haloplaca sp. 2 TL-2023]